MGVFELEVILDKKILYYVKWNYVFTVALTNV